MLLAWPPRSPDATPCNFFLWGYVKDQVSVPPLPASIQELKVRITTVGHESGEILKCEPREVSWTVTLTDKNMRDGHR
jgi:hypothetical protein